MGPVSGATDVDIVQASVSVGPYVLTKSVSLAVTAGSTTADVTIPAGVSLASVTLDGLKVQDPADGTKQIALASNSDLSGLGMFLVVSIQDASGGWTPFATAPAMGTVGMLPRALKPVSLQSKLLRLPAFAGSKCRFQVATGSDPQSFTPQPIAIASTITAQTNVTPSNLQLTGPDNAVLWSFPGVMPDGTPMATVDFGAALKRALKQSLGVPPALKFTLSASSAASAGIASQRISGAFLRVVPGSPVVTLSGDPVAVAIPDPALDANAPSSASAGVRVKYAGIRILPAINDQVPAGGTAQGVIVGSSPVVRTLPPQCLGGLAVAKIGVIGRAPEACSLTVQLVDMSSGAPGGPVGKPGIVKLDASDNIATVWADMPASPAPAGPVAVSVSCSQGRFYWVKADQPLTRLAVVDPDPAGRPIKIGTATLTAVDQADQTIKPGAIPSAGFASTPPQLSSELFATVTFSNLTLRYAR